MNAIPAFTQGEPVPPFHARSSSNPRFAFDTTAGRWIMVLLPGSMAETGLADRLAAMVGRHAARLDGSHA